jgi:hypothetical protein
MTPDRVRHLPQFLEIAKQRLDEVGHSGISVPWRRPVENGKKRGYRHHFDVVLENPAVSRIDDGRLDRSFSIIGPQRDHPTTASHVRHFVTGKRPTPNDPAFCKMDTLLKPRTAGSLNAAPWSVTYFCRNPAHNQKTRMIFIRPDP